jgi:hypothetical protein
VARINRSTGGSGSGGVRRTTGGMSGGSGRVIRTTGGMSGGSGSVNKSTGKKGSGRVEARVQKQGSGKGKVDATVQGQAGTMAPNPRQQANPSSSISSFLGRGKSGAKAVVTIGAGNARITATAKAAGPGSNSIRVALVNPGGTAARSISVAGNDITVNLAVTTGAIDGTETANSIVSALNAHGGASALASFAATPGDGTAVVAAVALTNLAGGQQVISGPGMTPGPHPTEAYG